MYNMVVLETCGCRQTGNSPFAISAFGLGGPFKFFFGPSNVELGDRVFRIGKLF